MAKGTPAIVQFNKGVISRLALARTDIKRTALAAETQTNWMPRVLGPMSLRPGLEFIGHTYTDLQAKFVPFVFSTDDTALLEFTNQHLRFWVDDEVLQRPEVDTVIVNGTFPTNLTGWTDSDQVGGVSSWVAKTAPATGGYMQLLGDGTNAARRDQQITVAVADRDVEHGLRILIHRGPVILRVGTAIGLDDYIEEMELDQGLHSLALTPTGNFWVRLESPLDRIVLVESVAIDAAGDLFLEDFYTTSDLYDIRWDQSGDVVFIACAGFQQVKVLRSETKSWSIVLYQPEDGPFRPENITTTTITPSATVGNITLTASKAIFKSTNVGSLYRIQSEGQLVVKNISAQNTFSDPIRVEGADSARVFSLILSGVWVATVTLQRGVTSSGPWIDVVSYTVNGTALQDDQLEDQILYYRAGVKTGDYTSGTVNVQLVYAIGQQTGVVRVTAFTSETVVSAEVFKQLGSTNASKVWSEGSWSERRGYPSAVSFYEGRLWWSGKNGIFGSVSDAFDGFDPDTEGASGPINRTIGSGPVDDINWLLPLDRLMIGAEGTEFSVRSTSFDEPITPTNFNIKGSSTQGSANVLPVKIDNRGAYIQRCGSRVYELSYSGESNNYQTIDLTALCMEIGRPGVVTMGVQRQPDTRIHAVRSDGFVAIGVTDKVENVLSWHLFETAGEVIDVVTLPGTEEDQVYYVVRRDAEDAVISIVPNPLAWAFTVEPTLTISGSGTGATAEVATMIVFPTGLLSGGAGYTVGDVLTVVGGTPTTSASQLTVTALDFLGGVASWSVALGGTYSTLPVMSLNAPTGGTGANASFSLSGYVDTVIVTNPGTGYTGVTTVGTTPISGLNLVVTTGDLPRVYLEKWALQTECVGETLSKLADSFVVYEGAPTATITGLDHLNGLDVVCWADGEDLSPDDEDGVQALYSVVNGEITLDHTVAAAVVGLPYDAPYKSAKLAVVSDEGNTALCQRKKVTQIGLVLVDTHCKGVKYGSDFDHLDDLPEVENATITPANTVYEQLDVDMMEFNGEWDTDSRVCLLARAPRCATVLAAVIAIEEEGKS